MLDRRRLDLTDFTRAATAAAETLTARLDEEHVLRSAAAILASDFDAAVARTWTLAPGTGEPVLRASAGGAEPGLDAVAARVARTRAPLATDDLEHVPGLDAGRAPGEGIATLVAFPLAVGGEVAGVLAALFRRSLADELRSILAIYATLVATVLDDARRRAREEEARRLNREHETRFRSVVDSNVIGFFEAASGKILDANDAFLSMIGRTREELGAGLLRWDELVPPDRAEALAQHRATVARTGRLEPVEGVFVRRDGVRVPVLVGAARRADSDSGFAFVVDLTRQKRTEAALATALRARDVFLSIASHELKTPLTTVAIALGSARRLLEKERAAEVPIPKLIERLANAERQVVQFAHLVDRLLDVSRLDDHRLSVEREDVDLAALAALVVDGARVDAAHAGSSLHLSAPAPVVGSWDRVRLEQVAWNLVANAIKYGRGRPIEVSVSRDATTARLVVRDHGIGISRDDQARIFQRFERAVSEENYGGLGLGLWMSRELVRAMDGTIAVESSPGQGATFTVSLPLVPERARP